MSAVEQPAGTGRVPSAEELFVALTRAGVVLVADGERLRVRAPRGALTAELRAAMELRRDALRQIVAARFRGPGECLAAQGNGRSIRPCLRMGACARPVNGRPCLVPATCCVCRAALVCGRRYLCVTCSDEDRALATYYQGDR
ncbi:MAG: hypothetical protein M3Q03_06070 [Chloroflexota bacterium]|nr:hypothetical protein [Chloroflexota bacterium]